MPRQADFEKIAEKAKLVRKLVGYAKRPFVIEFAGTPKSGKSTSVNSLDNFLRRNEFSVHVLLERASFCPIPTKGHLFFNTWTAATMLAELLQNVETPTHVIIKDRGIFDSLVWLQLQYRRGEVSRDELNTIAKFMLLERWRNIVDLVVVMRVQPQKALERETATLISSAPGTVMRSEVLTEFNDALDVAVREYRPAFKGFIELDTSSSEPRSTNLLLAEQILATLEHFLNSPILVVPRRSVETFLKPSAGGEFRRNVLKEVLGRMDSVKTMIPRDEAEKDERHMQIVPCAVLTHRGKVFTFQRKEQDPNYHLYGKTTIWRGTHVTRHPPSVAEEQLKKTVLSRIADDLFLSRQFESQLVGLTWDLRTPHSRKHLGLVFLVDIDSDDVALAIHEKEFRKGRGHGLRGAFGEPRQILASDHELSLEPWSKEILRYLLDGGG